MTAARIVRRQTAEILAIVSAIPCPCASIADSVSQKPCGSLANHPAEYKPRERRRLYHAPNRLMPRQVEAAEACRRGAAGVGSRFSARDSGVPIADASMSEAIEIVHAMLRRHDGCTRRRLLRQRPLVEHRRFRSRLSEDSQRGRYRVRRRDGRALGGQAPRRSAARQYQRHRLHSIATAGHRPLAAFLLPSRRRRRDN